MRQRILIALNAAKGEIRRRSSKPARPRLSGNREYQALPTEDNPEVTASPSESPSAAPSSPQQAPATRQRGKITDTSLRPSPASTAGGSAGRGTPAPCSGCPRRAVAAAPSSAGVVCVLQRRLRALQADLARHRERAMTAAALLRRAGEERARLADANRRLQDLLRLRRRRSAPPPPPPKRTASASPGGHSRSGAPVTGRSAGLQSPPSPAAAPPCLDDCGKTTPPPPPPAPGLAAARLERELAAARRALDAHVCPAP
jgi:hypothetical protein